MERNAKRVVTDFTEDRISSLPDMLIDYILGCLTDDFGLVVRTSVLSKRWRFCWTRVRKLKFNLPFFKTYPAQLGRLDDFVSILDSVLSKHDADIDHFFMCTDGIERTGSRFDFCSRMEILTQKKIRELSITIIPHFYLSNPARIFTCSTLMHLTLSFCYVEPSTELSGLTSLVSLNLNHIFIPSELLVRVIANSPLLTSLELTEMGFVGSSFVAINAPGLQTLTLKDKGKFHLIEYPNLTTACLMAEIELAAIGRGGPCKLNNFAQLMPRVERLTLSADALKALAVGCIPLKLPGTFENLKDIKFKGLDIFYVDHLSCAFCLIRSSPSLESVKIYVDDSSDIHQNWDAAFSFYEEQVKVGLLSQVSLLRFHRLRGTRCEVKLISTFVKCCLMLKAILFKFSSYMKRKSKDWLLTEIEELPLSETVFIKYLMPRGLMVSFMLLTRAELERYMAAIA